jgi:hypothetical protein
MLPFLQPSAPSRGRDARIAFQAQCAAHNPARISVAFGIRRNVFNFEHVDCFIVRDGERVPIRRLEAGRHRKVIRIGSLADGCKIV